MRTPEFRFTVPFTITVLFHVYAGLVPVLPKVKLLSSLPDPKKGIEEIPSVPFNIKLDELLLIN
ncbi:MAG: hypothetical protein RIF39_05010, partial [Cyclobacteriaceae bacterium]